MEEGNNYRVTDSTGMMYVGRLQSVIGPHTWILEDAVWVAETGTRLGEFIKGKTNESTEVEPVGVICVHWASWGEWKHKLFTRAMP